jgi:hypothetical protein
VSAATVPARPGRCWCGHVRITHRSWAAGLFCSREGCGCREYSEKRRGGEVIENPYSILDVLSGYAGECFICGGPDKRHRLADSIISNVRGGDSVASVARAYEVPEEAVRTLVEYAAKRSRQHKARWPA